MLHKISLNTQNHITFSSNYSKILSLTLNNKIIIQSISQKQQSFLSSGSYLMFPWVNRVENNPYKNIKQNKFNDQNGLPLHGLYANQGRQVKIQQFKSKQSNIKQDKQDKKDKKDNQLSSIKITLTPSNPHPSIHSFTQTYTLSSSSLLINFFCHLSLSDPSPYCFGYHPYFKFQNFSLSQLQLNHNLSKHIKLNPHTLLPQCYPYEDNSWDGKILCGVNKYDDLFMGNQKDQVKFVEIKKIKQGNKNNKIKIQSDLVYWQIYTPQDNKTIAIQPMSFHANIYEVYKGNQQIKQQLPSKGYIKISVQ